MAPHVHCFHRRSCHTLCFFTPGQGWGLAQSLLWPAGAHANLSFQPWVGQHEQEQHLKQHRQAEARLLQGTTPPAPDTPPAPPPPPATPVDSPPPPATPQFVPVPAPMPAPVPAPAPEPPAYTVADYACAGACASASACFHRWAKQPSCRLQTSQLSAGSMCMPQYAGSMCLSLKASLAAPLWPCLQPRTPLRSAASASSGHCSVGLSSETLRPTSHWPAASPGSHACMPQPAACNFHPTPCCMLH